MQPVFLDSEFGSLFAIYFAPTQVKPERALLHVHAFAEEMNKSRRMVSLQAKALSEEGYAVLVLDLFGMGDSAGDFGEATWPIWLDNIHTAITWLKQQGIQEISLWGLRLGALLAMDYIDQRGDDIQRLLLWQPVLNSDNFLSQFLRLRVAASIMNTNQPKEKTSELKQCLQSGESIEVAGYSLNPELINPLLKIKPNPVSWKHLRSVDIFEIVSNESTQSAFAFQQFMGGVSDLGIEASFSKVVGDSFWASQEITFAPTLLLAMQERVKLWH